jgi:hypothetical protein
MGSRASWRITPPPALNYFAYNFIKIHRRLRTSHISLLPEMGRSQPFVVVSGFVANLQQWQMFERVWKESHDEAGVDLPFHVTEFMSACRNPKYANQNSARADYVRLANDPKAARLFFDRLAIAAISAVHCGISCIVPMDIYNNVSSLLDLREVVPPYALAAHMCIEKLHQWEQLFAIGESAESIFEAGDF